MKKIITLSALLLSTMIYPSSSFAQWTKISTNVNGDEFYLDFERIRKNKGYVYFWQMTSYLNKNKHGDFSDKMYARGDCETFRFKNLSSSFHKKPMGKDLGTTIDVSKYPKYASWRYPSPGSSQETVLKRVCNE